MSLAAVLAPPSPRDRRSRRGRPSRDADGRRVEREAAVGRWRLGDLTASEVGRAFGVHPSTLRRWAREFAAN